MKDKQISIRLTADKHARLSTLAWLEHSPSAAALMTKLIEDALAQNAGRINAAIALRSPESSIPVADKSARPAEETAAPPVEGQPEDIAAELNNLANDLAITAAGKFKQQEAEVVVPEPEGGAEDKPAEKKSAVDRENNISLLTPQSPYSQNLERAAV